MDTSSSTIIITLFSALIKVIKSYCCHTTNLSLNVSDCCTILKEISPGNSLEGMMLKLKLLYFGHLMRRVDSLETTLRDWGQEEKADGVYINLIEALKKQVR